jgi:hypothetical protein
VFSVSLWWKTAENTHHRASLLVGQADNKMKLWWRAGEG